MLTIFMSITLISSIIFLFLKHPLSMGLILLIQTITISLTMGFFNLNFWYSYILFLVMIGGMLVLFIYMTSVASNEKFMFSFKIMMLIMLLTIITLIMLMLIDPYYSNLNSLYTETLNYQYNYTLSLNKFLSPPMNMILLMLIIYLLITLIAVVKITNIKKGPLRQTH
uniref:NADH-ubiquinone oxidoreductase chain 6 n=1 Tax=Rhopaea magnicornis TaxID=272071 RepID=C8YXE0_9SCAR|nr:NADH dehydrogenase subunit 6 [Rhopaea magnicornis]ACO92574.1 NADH dehydrogenase subunit 6 [Rhopaea magnicornis]